MYHFTDVLPAVVSGDSLVMFDPHVNYLPGATAAQPGIRIKFCDAKLLQHFPDQFKPFCFFGNDLGAKPFQGTLFRFPLRTKDLTGDSEISKASYDDPTLVHELIASFRATAERFLLFLRNVRRIEMFILDDQCAGDEPRPLFTVDADRKALPAHALSSANSSGGSDRRHWSAIQDFITGPDAGRPMSKDQFYQRLATTPVERLPVVEQMVTVTFTELQKLVAATGSNRGGSTTPLAIVDEINVSSEDPSSTLRIAAPLSQPALTRTRYGNKTSHWVQRRKKKEEQEQETPGTPRVQVDEFLVVACLGGGRAQAMAVDPKNQAMKFIPWGGVAAHLKRNGLRRGSGALEAQPKRWSRAPSRPGPHRAEAAGAVRPAAGHRQRRRRSDATAPRQGLLLPATARLYGRAGAHQRLLPAVVEPPRHLVRPGHGRRGQAPQRVE